MTKYDNVNFKEKIDKFFFWFENNKFTNQGDYPRNTNLVLEFYDYTETLSDDELAGVLGLDADFKDLDDAIKAASKAREMINNGIDKWLEA